MPRRQVMGMKITKKPDFKKYTKRINNSNQALMSLSESLITGIIRRTQKGVDSKNKAFKPYSKVYGKKGRVNLTVTSAMLHSITPKKINKGIKLHFPIDAENEKAYDNHVKYDRKFFGLDKNQIKLIVKRLGKHIKDGIK